MTTARSMAGTPARKPWWAMFDKRWLIILARLWLAAMFLTSAIGKLPDIEAYSVDIVYDFGILPMWAARPFGLAMPFIELLCALGLLGGVLTRLSAFGLTLMNLAFFIAKGVLLLQGRNLNCGCFGAVMDTMASFSIWLDIPNFLFALFIVLASQATRHNLALGHFLPQALKDKFNLVW